MLLVVLVTFIDLFVFIFTALLVVRVFSSYIVKPGSRFYVGLASLTEPLLVPVRRVLPKVPGVDIAPLAAFFALQGIDYLVHLLFHA